jgi:acetyl-CoA carboxylase biotin carboxyl carrier protein
MSAPTALDVEVLSELLEQSGWKWMRVRMGGVELELGHRPTGVAEPAPAVPTPVAAPPVAPPAVAALPAAAQPPTPPPTESAAAEGWVDVVAPSLGSFYRAPAPGEPAYVQVGEAVTAGQEVGLLEVMKLYSPVLAPQAGTVREICVPDGEMVQAGQPLVRLEPAG